MEDIIREILHINEEIREIKRQIELLKKKPDTPFREDWVDGQGAVRALHISLRTLRTLRLSGKLPYTRLHKKIYYKVTDIRHLLEENYIRYHYPNDHD